MRRAAFEYEAFVVNLDHSQTISGQRVGLLFQLVTKDSELNFLGAQRAV